MMNKTRLLFVLAIAALLFSCNASSDTKAVEGEGSSYTTPEASNANMGSLSFERLDGTSFNLSELQGKRVFLSFWATWCKPCIQEMPSIEQVQKELGEEVVFLLASDESKEQIEAFAKRKGYDLTFVKANFALDRLGITGLPTNIILDDTGKQDAFLVGARDWHSEEGMALIRGVKVGE